MPYTSVSKADKNRFGLKSHTVPMIIAIAYLVDSIEAEMTLLRMATLILDACYVISIFVAMIQRMRDSHARGVSDGANADADNH